MKHADIAIVTSLAFLSADCMAGGFIEDSTTTISTRGLYFENDVRERGGSDQRQSALGIRLDFTSGYTTGSMGVGLDVQALQGVGLGGGIDNQSPSTVNTVTPVKTDGSPADDWSRLGANAKFKYPPRSSKSVTLWRPIFLSSYQTTRVSCLRHSKVQCLRRKIWTL